MRITLDRALFDVQSEAEAMALLDLLSTAVHDLHDHALLTDPIYQPGDDNGEIDSWLAQRSSFEANAFRALLTKGILSASGSRSQPAWDKKEQPRRWHLSGSLEIRVERRTESDWRSRVLTLADAVDLLHEPVHLILENTRTEPAFLRHLAGPTDGATLQKLLAQPGRIEKHGGGSEAKPWIDALTKGGPTPAKWRQMLRAWILFDQDAGDKDARAPSTSALRLMSACEKVVSDYGVGLSWICLRRREIESYIPDSGLLAQRAEKKAFVDQVIAWRKDSERQSWAWALDLKNGLHGDRHSEWSVGLSKADADAISQRKKTLEPPMLKAPFSGLSAMEINILSSPLSDAIGEALRDTEPTWAADLPDEYDRGPSDQAPRDLFVKSLFDRM